MQVTNSVDVLCLNYQLNYLNFSLLRKVSHKCRISLLQIWYRLQKRNVGSTLQIHSDRMQIHLTSFLHCANIFNASMVNMWALMSCHFFWLYLRSRTVWMTTFTNQTSHLMREIQKSVQKKRKTFSKCQKILHVSISTPTIYSTIKQNNFGAKLSSNAVSFVARNESSEWFKLKPKTFTYLKILWIFCWLQKCHEYYYESFIVESKRATRIKDFSSSMAHLLLLLSLVFCILVAYFQIEYEMRLSSNENVFRCDVQDWKYMQRQEISISVVSRHNINFFVKHA